ncbi:MAG: type II secretion system protein [Planctomycetota bacterium]
MKRWGGISQGSSGATGPRGFTIVELLIVIAVIIMLMSILIVAINAATRTAQGTNTRALMASMKQALVRFNGDIGYLPPVLGIPNPVNLDADNHDLRKLFGPRGVNRQWDASSSDDILPELRNGNPNNNYAINVQDWYSVTTLAEYLLGYGHHNQDGYGYISPNQGGPLYDGSPGQPDERPPEGIRDPGSDAVWGATINLDADGGLASRMQGVSESVDIGKVYGPYLELRDEQAVAGVDWDPARHELIVTFPGDSNYDPYGPKVLVDYWGKPIRYYRKLYSPGDLRSPYRRINRTPPMLPEPTLADVYLLRPYEVDPGGATDSIYADAAGDTTITATLRSAEFALFSSGPDRAFDPTTRYDARDNNDDGVDYSNEDNIVELGP